MQVALRSKRTQWGSSLIFLERNLDTLSSYCEGQLLTSGLLHISPLAWYLGFQQRNGPHTLGCPGTEAFGLVVSCVTVMQGLQPADDLSWVSSVAKNP